MGIAVMGAAITYPTELAGYTEQGLDIVAHPTKLDVWQILFLLPIGIWKARHVYEDFADGRLVLLTAIRVLKSAILKVKFPEATILYCF
jgi:hypothetical protein